MSVAAQAEFPLSSGLSETPPNSNPYRQLAAILLVLHGLATIARRTGQDHFDRSNEATEPWRASEASARRNSLEKGIPFGEFDTALRQANEDLQELMQVAGCNFTTPFNHFDLRFCRTRQVGGIGTDL